MPLKPAQIKTAALATAGVATLVAVFGIIKPDLAERTQDQTQAAQIEDQIAAAAQAAQQAPDHRTAAQIERSLRTFSAMFPATYQQQQWLDSINAAAQTAGVAITGLSATPPTSTPPTTGTTVSTTADSPTAPAGPLAESKVTVDAKGPTGAIARFLGDIETSKRPLVVSAVTLNVDSDTGVASAGINGQILLAQMPDATVGS